MMSIIQEDDEYEDSNRYKRYSFKKEENTPSTSPKNTENSRDKHFTDKFVNMIKSFFIKR